MDFWDPLFSMGTEDMSPSLFEICLEQCAELLPTLLLESLDFFAELVPLDPPAALSLALLLLVPFPPESSLGEAGAGFSDIVLGDSDASKSFDCTLAENRTVSSSVAWEVLELRAETEEPENSAWDVLESESKGAFPAETLPES